MIFKKRFRTPLLGEGRSAAPRRTRQPRLERLEDRALLTLSFNSAFGVGANTFSSTPGALQLGRIAVDAAGDSFETGSFTGQVNFAPGGSMVLNATSTTGFVAKYSPSGSLDWVYEIPPDASTAGGTSTATGVAVDPSSGAVYVSGSFSGKVDLVAGSSQYTITSNGGLDGFVLELDSSGNYIPGKARSFGGPGTDFTAALKLGNNGSGIYVSGIYTGQNVNFDPGGSNTTLPGLGPNVADTFLLRLNNDLSFRSVAAVGQANSNGVNVAIDGSGSAYVVGNVAGSSGTDAFVARFDSSGNHVQTVLFGGPSSGGSNAQATGVVTDTQGNIYVGGTFSGTGVNFGGPFGSGNLPLDSLGGSDAFLIKLNSGLGLSWGRRFGSSGTDNAFDLGIDAGNNLYLVGRESGNTTFGTTGAGISVLSNSSGLSAGYVLQVDPNGNLLQGGAVAGAGTGQSAVNNVAVNASGLVVVDGFYTSGATIGATSLPGAGSSEFFQATLTNPSPSPIPTPVTPAPTPTPTTPTPTTPTPTPAAPVFTGVTKAFTGTGKKKKFVGFAINFSGAVNSADAMNVARYHVTQPGKTRKAPLKIVPVLGVVVGPGATSLRLVLPKTSKPPTVTITGLLAANGATITAGPFVL